MTRDERTTMKRVAYSPVILTFVVGLVMLLFVRPLGGQSSSVGQWSAVFDMPLVAVHTALMPSGDVLLWDAWEIPGTPSVRLWNPTTNTYISVPNTFAELFCSGHVLASDGRVITVGGHNGSGVGTTDTTVFDPATRLWTQLANLGYARWYPGASLLADGRVLTLGGSISRPEVAEVPEVYTIGSNTWASLPAAQKDVGEYPRIFPLPNGRLFVADQSPSLQSWQLDVDAKAWTSVGQSPAPTGAGVMYRPGKVMMSGGGTGATDPIVHSTGVIDLTVPSPAWRQTSPMAFPRNLHNLVILPDGKVLAVGGSTEISLISTSGILPAEIWDPTLETWTTVASMVTPRMYHSTALLLPDGRVLSAGGGRLAPAVDHLNGELYSPPYLFSGTRPAITGAPPSISYGSTFSVTSPNSASTARVTLVRSSSVTHGVNYDQRFVELAFTQGAGGLTVQAPSNANIAPTGYYLLFILDANNVPSVARVVRMDAAPTGPAVSINDVSVTEGTGGVTTAVFSVTLTGATAQTVTVDYSTADGTANADSDYTAISGRLTFPPGTNTQTISVPIVTDSVIEPNETFSVLLSNPINTTIVKGMGTGTIINDDVPSVPTLSIDDVRVTEGTGSGTPVASFTVTLFPASPQNVLVNFRTIAGTATAPDDFANTSGTLTFAGGSTVQTIQVPIVPDATSEPDETFTVELSNAVNAVITRGVGVGTILNDDSVTATFSIASGADDANEDGATFDAQGSSLWLGDGASTTSSFVGLRFAGVSIPRGATVQSARLQINSASTQWISINFEYAAEASADSPPLSAANKPSQRTLLAPRVTHSSDAQWLANTSYTLDEIAPIVQAVVGQSGWSQGNALTLIARGTGNGWARKFARSFESDPTRAAKLMVTYSGVASSTPAVTFSASPITITPGGSSTLTWTTSNATGAAIDQGVGPVTLSGSRIVSPAATTTYTFTASNLSGSTSGTATVTVAPPLPTAGLVVNPTTIAPGASGTLSWTTTNATTVALDQGIGTVGPTGSRTVSPATTTTYRLTATNATGSTTATATLTVTVPPPPPPTATLSASPGVITAGGSATLTWATTNATSASLDQGIGPVSVPSGSRIVSPSATTTYSLVAANASGSATSSALVTVNPAPPSSSSSSLKFNGTSSRARFTTMPAMTVFTVEIWVKRTTDTGRYETFLSNAASGYSRETFGLYVDGGNADCGSNPPDQFAWGYTKANSGWFFQCSGVSANLNAWHHVAVTRDAANTARIFVDGVLKGAVANTQAPTSSTGALAVGDAADALTEYFPGLVDEVRISSIARYTASFTPQVANFVTDASTIALYHFDETTGQTLADASGNNRSGVLGTSPSAESADPQWSTDVPVH